MRNHIVSVGSVSGPEDLKKAIQDLVVDVLERGYEEPEDMVVISDSGFLETMKILTDRIIRRAVDNETMNLKADLLRRLCNVR